MAPFHQGTTIIHAFCSKLRKKETERKRERERERDVSKHWSRHCKSLDEAKQLHYDLAPFRQGTTIIDAFCCKFGKKAFCCKFAKRERETERERERERARCVEALIVAF